MHGTPARWMSPRALKPDVKRNLRSFAFVACIAVLADLMGRARQELWRRRPRRWKRLVPRRRKKASRTRHGFTPPPPSTRLRGFGTGPSDVLFAGVNWVITFIPCDGSWRPSAPVWSRSGSGTGIGAAPSFSSLRRDGSRRTRRMAGWTRSAMPSRPTSSPTS